jgi:O-antigen ligase
MVTAGPSPSRAQRVLLLVSGCIAAGGAIVVQPRLLGLAAMAIAMLLLIEYPRFALLGLVPLLVLVSPSRAAAIYLTRAVPLGLGALVLVWGVRRTARLSIPALLQFGVVAAWLLICYASASGPTSGIDVRNQLILAVGLFPLAVVAASARPSLSQLQLVLALTGVAAAGIAGAGQLLDSGRLSGLGNNPNGLGLILAVGLVAMATLVTGREGPLALCGCAFIAWQMIATQSQGAFLAAAAGVAAIFFAGWTWKRRIQVGALLVLATVALFPEGASIYHHALTNRTAEDLTLSKRVRTLYLKAGLRYTVEHPVIGIGFGRFPAETDADPAIGYPSSAHNLYIGIAAETGLVGLGLFVIMFLRAARSLPRGKIGRGISAVLVTYLVGFCFGTYLSTWQIMAPFWIIVGTLIGADGRTSRDCGSES